MNKSVEKAVEAPFIHVVAVDDGSGNIAMIYEDEAGEYNELIMPSLVEAGVAATFGETPVQAWVVGGNEYTVNPSTTKPLSTLDPDYQVGEVSRVLVNDILVKSGLGGKPCVIGCTIPVNQYYLPADTDGDRTDHARIQEKQASLLSKIESFQGIFTPPEILHVEVYPECLTAYVYCAVAVQERKKMGDDPDGAHTTLIVDLGEFTADFAILETGYKIDRYATYEHGIHKMISFFRSMILRDARSLGLPDVSSMPIKYFKLAIERGYIGSPSDSPAAIAARVDVTPYIERAANKLNELLLADIREVTRGQLISMTRVVFVGGGANLLREQAREWCHTVVIPEEPELAVVRGMHIMLNQRRDSLVEQARNNMKDAEHGR